MSGLREYLFPDRSLLSACGVCIFVCIVFVSEGVGLVDVGVGLFCCSTYLFFLLLMGCHGNNYCHSGLQTHKNDWDP